ncbi:hypothetical protein SFHH103_01675 [Sinorhizobium fredii HH103]|uniref:Uncharacterized protein n=1 Tax=Sinorhizobium fredii (strain HH103) TaxID=1117943 RepID=G9A7E2_SINF1|nr:hypothetical protein [Sinorhizobium fredii]CCE96172.1 hypothetical protein SFHH103_01675 [Sinorhizobium fredii HH103]
MAAEKKDAADAVMLVLGLLPCDRREAADAAMVICAMAAISGGLDDETAICGLRAALESLRGCEFGAIGRAGVH